MMNRIARKRGRRGRPYGDWEEEVNMKERTRGTRESALIDCQGNVRKSYLYLVTWVLD